MTAAAQIFIAAFQNPSGTNAWSHTHTKHFLRSRCCEDVAIPTTIGCHSISEPSTPPPKSKAVIEGYTFCTPVNSSLSSSTSIQMNHDEYDELYLESLSRPSSSLVHEGYNTTISSNDFTEYYVCRDYAYGEHLYLDMLSMTSGSETSSSSSSTCSGGDTTVISEEERWGL